MISPCHSLHEGGTAVLYSGALCVAPYNWRWCGRDDRRSAQTAEKHLEAGPLANFMTENAYWPGPTTPNATFEHHRSLRSRLRPACAGDGNARARCHRIPRAAGVMLNSVR